MPNRIPSLFEKGANALPAMIETAKNLEGAGIDFIVIPCNHGHYLYQDLQKKMNTPILNIIEEIVKRIRADISS